MTNPNGYMMTDDPYESAANAKLAPRSYYGQISIDAWFCALIKGVGKVPFDPQQHDADKRCTAMDIIVTPIAEQQLNFELKREMIAESREWAGIVWPSLKELGATSPREVHNKWCKMQQVPSGRKYRAKDGTEKEATTFKFLALFDSEAECRAAYNADTGGGNDSNSDAAEPTPGNGSANLDVARPFIMAFAKQNAFDLEKTRAACSSQAVITNAIDINSPEFAEIVAEALAAGGK
jgi:hypothetical protein